MIANLITVSRILLFLFLLPLSPYSVLFTVIYLLCGVTDVLDGFLARKFHTESKIGERLDSIADIVFAVVYAVKILPILYLPLWIWCQTVLIAVVKIVGIIIASKKELLVYGYKVGKISLKEKTVSFLKIEEQNFMKELETERLILRKLHSVDCDRIFSCWANDEEVTRYLTWFPHRSPVETRTILERWQEEYNYIDCYRFGIELKESRQLIGMLDVVDYRNGNPEIGYVPGRRYWNHGYMTETFSANVDNF